MRMGKGGGGVSAGSTMRMKHAARRAAEGGDGRRAGADILDADTPSAALLRAWRGESAGEPALAVRSDLGRDGHFGESWLLADDIGLAAWEREGEADAWQKLDEWVWDDIEDVGMSTGTGVGCFELTVAAVKRRLLVFTDARRPEFSDALGVLKHYRKEGNWDAPPSKGRRRICPSCERPLEDSVESCPYCVNKRQLLLRIIGYALPHRRLLILLFGLMAASSAIGLVTPYLSKILIDEILLPMENLSWLGPLVGAMVATYVGHALLESWHGMVSARIGNRAVHDLRSDLFRHLQALSLAFISRFKTGNLISRVNADTGQLQRLMVDFLPFGFNSILTTAGVLILLLNLSWKLTLIVLIPVTVFMLAIRLVVPRFRRYWHRFTEERSRLYSFVSDSLNGVRVVKAFGREKSTVDRFDDRSSGFRDSAIEAETRMAQVFPLMRVIVMMGSPIVWLVGGYQIFKGGMTLGDVVAFQAYLMMLYQPIYVIARLAQMIPNALAAGARIFEVLDAKPDVEEAPDAVAMPDMQGRVTLQNVSFGYEAHKPVLEDVDLELAPGERIGLVGHSGAGKSTTINLVCRLYDPQKGAILIDGVDMRKIRLQDLHRQIGIVLQESFLLTGTIADNIRYARPDASPLDIIRSARAANAHDFICRKPDAYDTEVAEGGGNLSGGEKQRVSIARAILCDPRILILDEATSSVDLQTEKQIQEALQRLTANRTTIAIAHRLSTLKNCHRLVVLDKGRVEDVGTHDELVSRDGTYAKLVHLHREMSELTGVAT